MVKDPPVVEAQKPPPEPKPKRKCSKKQLENLKNGREKSSLYHKLKEKKV
jgi:hypothetical protein